MFAPRWLCPHRGWQVSAVGCHVLHGGGQIPTDGGRSLKRVTVPTDSGRSTAGWQISAVGFQSPMEEHRSPWQVPTTFPNSTGDALLQFAGVWHVTAIASNCSIFLKMKDGMKSSVAIISFTPEGDLAMKLVWPLMDKCQKFELLFQQSGQAGHYMGAQEKRNLSVMETDYSHYAVLREVQLSEAEPSMALQLLSALGVGTWLLGRDGGTSGQGLGFPPRARATTSSTPCPSPRELILG
ncbi:uncharacterized protein LOC121336910 isoform X1 [Onychostruthus taczanowskii]|uniref:uncharacterized protein LOC121336910 isoform X1 n=1 Tax=Onychostruthus taczanowskii TaxID=356909 RepID=UPI001B80C1AB|nr:uncharacterized protein LOC121336910 isoform X1 [Onychostruthus taczanowskii]